MLQDLFGKKFGRLLVIEEGIKKDSKTISPKTGKFYQRKTARCLCDCGNYKDVEPSSLINGHTKSCGCFSSEETSKRLWKGCNNLSGQRFCQIKNAALARNLIFEISIEYAWNLFIKQNKKCAITNLELCLNRNGKNQTASLDRIDSSKGYTEDNVWWVHKDINQMKWDFTLEKFYELCKLVIENKNV